MPDSFIHDAYFGFDLSLLVYHLSVSFVVVFCLYVFGLPLINLFVIRLEVAPTVEPLDDLFALDAKVRRQFDAAAEALRPLGFEGGGLFILPQLVKNVQLIICTFVNREESEFANAAAIYVSKNNKDWKLRFQYTGFTAYFADGTEISLHNHRLARTFPAPPGEITVVAPWLQRPAELCRAHRAISALLAPAKQKEFPLDTDFQGDIARFVSDGLAKEYAFARDAGYLVEAGNTVVATVAPDSGNPYQSPGAAAASAVYVATVKGAFLMTWRCLWPFRTWILASRVRRAKRLLADAGFEQTPAS